MQLNERKFRGSVDCNEQIELSLICPDFGNVDVEETDRIKLEPLFRGRAAFGFWQAADAVPLQAAMQ